MFRLATNRLLTTGSCGSLFNKITYSIVYESRANYIRGFWPEPITQQTLAQFLKDINYFQEHKELVNIGLQKSQSPKVNQEPVTPTPSPVDDDNLVAGEQNEQNLDELLQMLGRDSEVPSLDYNDVLLEGEELVKLAINSGVYRDLFGQYVPDKDYIRFTPEQAERMNRLVPPYWITDQPFARVDRRPKDPDPIYYFEPLVGISARFVSSGHSNQLYAHTSYYGNVIPASEALTKPSITLDGRKLSPTDPSNTLTEAKFNNWTPGQVTSANFQEKPQHFYTVILVNLDHLHQKSTNLHWMITNISPSPAESELCYEEVCDYLPVHGIRGFGYSRYVFLVLQHNSKFDKNQLRVKDFSLDSRKFEPKLFLEQNKSIGMVPVGLSWFQTNWDVSSNMIFHDYLKLRAPVYEHVQQKNEDRSIDKSYPGKVPFNIFLDHTREKKDINQQVLLERLKTVDPEDYKDQYVPPKVPPTVFKDENIPSWMTTVMFKKKNRIGYWRGLRPASASLPLNNNEDLDYPLRPIVSGKKTPPGFHNQYPARIKYKKHKDMPTSKPANEHSAVFIQEDHEIHLDQVREMMKEFESKEEC